MLHQVKAALLGTRENMNYPTSSHCRQRIDVWSHGGGLRTAKQMDVHFLGELTLDPQIRIGGDSGQPIVRRKGEGEPFLALARNAMARLEAVGHDQGPKFDISD